MSVEAARILVVDDNQDVLVAARLLLKQQGYQARTETDPQAIPSALKQESPAVVLLDMNFTQEATSGREGFYWLKQISDLDPTVAVLLIHRVRRRRDGRARRQGRGRRFCAQTLAEREAARHRVRGRGIASLAPGNRPPPLSPAAAVRGSRPALWRSHRRGPSPTGSISDNGPR